MKLASRKTGHDNPVVDGKDRLIAHIVGTALPAALDQAVQQRLDELFTP
jgi:hypothetical protein